MDRSIFIQSIIPPFLQEAYPRLVNFLEKYYQYFDSKKGEVICVVVKEGGKNYSNSATISFYRKENNQYVIDNKGAIAYPYVVNGKIEKVILTNPGKNYQKADELIAVVNDNSGSGAVIVPKVLYETSGLSTIFDVQYARDVDLDNEIFSLYLKNELIKKFPSLYSGDVSVDFKKFVKFIKQLYNSNGTEDSFRFLYRIIFNSNVDFYYPKIDILRCSDGKWAKDVYLIFTPKIGIDPIKFSGTKIITENGYVAVLNDIVPDPFIAGKYRTIISDYTPELNDNNRIGEKIYIYKFSLKLDEEIGTIHSFYREPGRFLNDDGFPSSSKKIQDSYYYQDFSYELQSDVSIRKYLAFLEELVHPAGLKYFLKINAINDIVIDSIQEKQYINLLQKPDICAEAENKFNFLFNSYKNLIENRIGRNVSVTKFKFNYEFVPSTPVTTITLFTQPNLVVFNSGYSLIGKVLKITTGSNIFVRTIINYNENTNQVTLDSAFTPTGNIGTIEFIEAYKYQNLNNIQKKLQLSNYDFNSVSIIDSTYENRYLNGWSVYLLYENGSYERRTIINYDGNTRTISYNLAFSGNLNANTVYFIVPDINGSQYYGKRILNILVNSGGQNYTAPTIVIEPSPNGSQATATVQTVNGAITGITITNGGSGYIWLPEIKIEDSTGNGAILNVILDEEPEAAFYNYFKMTRLHGVSVQMPNAFLNEYKRASGFAEINNFGSLTSAIITNQGDNYYFSPRVCLYGGLGQDAKITATVTNKKVTFLNIQNFGLNYEEAPELFIESPFLFENENLWFEENKPAKIIDYDETTQTASLVFNENAPSPFETKTAEFKLGNKTINNIVTLQPFYSDYQQSHFLSGCEIEVMRQ